MICSTLSVLNIAILGKAGVGKRTLMDSTFREKVATTGLGTPVTMNIRRTEKRGIPLAIYSIPKLDFKEGNYEQVEEDIETLVNAKEGKQDTKFNIHCVLYCIDASSTTVEDAEMECLKRISSKCSAAGVPVIVVLTKCHTRGDDLDRISQQVQTENLPIAQVVPVLAKEFETTEGIIPPFGLDNLVRALGEAVPEGLHQTISNMQMVCLSEKHKSAHGAVALAVALAAGTAATPIPFSDCLLLIPIQVGMLAAVTNSFGFEIRKEFLSTVASSAIGTLISSYLGRMIVSRLLRFIPGVGALASAAISIGTASLLTTALGEAYIIVLTMVFNNEMSMEELISEKGRELINQKFQEAVHNNGKVLES